jgi:hypothetical protein
MDRAALVLSGSSAVDCGGVVVAGPPRAVHSRTVRQEWRPTMIVIKHVRTFTMATASLASLLLAVAAQPLKVDFSNESVGAEPKSFLSVVGVWRMKGKKCWSSMDDNGRKGKPQPGLPTKLAHFMASATPNFLTLCRLTH